MKKSLQILFVVVSVVLVSCTGQQQGDKAADTATPVVADSVPQDSVVVDTLRAVDQAAARQAFIDSLNRLPEYKELVTLVKEEHEQFPKELMPGLMLVDNLLSGQDFFYMYIVDENKMSFNEIVSKRDEFRASMASSINNAVHEKGNPMRRFVQLCVKNGVSVNYLFKAAQSRRDLTITFTPSQLQQLTVVE